MDFVKSLLLILLLVTAIFLIVLVLIQRGKGGGLAGAFGGMGGQSAFGTKAGDLFTKITIGVASFWIILCLVTVAVLGVGSKSLLDSDRLGGGGQQGANFKIPDKQGKPAGEAPKGGDAPAPAEKPAK